MNKKTTAPDKNLKSKRYDGDNCPCPALCSRKGDCKACIAFHRKDGGKTYCEKIYEEELKPSIWLYIKKVLIWLSQVLCPS